MTRKRFCIIILLTSFLFGCSNKYQESIYGKYVFNDIIYLSSLSSSSIDNLKKNMEGTEFTIKKDLFKILSTEVDYEIKNPIYEKKELVGDIEKILGENLLNGYKTKVQFTILSSENEKTQYCLYSMDGEVWLALYIDNTANNSVIIMSIYKLDKID